MCVSVGGRLHVYRIASNFRGLKICSFRGKAENFPQPTCRRGLPERMQYMYSACNELTEILLVKITAVQFLPHKNYPQCSSLR